MERPDIWVVVPASRPENRAQVLTNFFSQEQEARLLIVENGEAIGAYDGHDGLVRIQSEQHHSSAKNAGLSWLRENAPVAYYVGMDDDDFYGPKYLSEHAKAAEHGVVRGKRNGWVLFDSGLEYFSRPGNKGDEAGSLIGGTIGGYADEIPDFPIQVAEEHGFCEEARARGLSVRLLSPLHYCYNRTGDPRSHAWKADEEKIRRRLGGKSVPVHGTVQEWIGRLPAHKETACLLG